MRCVTLKNVCNRMKKTILIAPAFLIALASCDKEEQQGAIDVKQISIADVSSDTVKLNLGDTYQLKVSTTPAEAVTQLKYITANARVFTVSQDGLVTAKGGGTGTLTIVGANGETVEKAHVVIDVTELVTSIATNETYKQVILAPNATHNVSSYFTVAPYTATNKTLQYISSDPSVITVNENGLVTYVSKGSAEVTAKSTDGGNVVASPILFYSGYTTTAVSGRTAWKATASSGYSDTNTYRAARAIDGSTSGGTFWHANWDVPVPFPLYFQIDFGEAKSFTEVEIYRRSSPYMDTKDVEFYIIPADVTTEDGITWTDERYVLWGELSFVGGPVSGVGVDARNKTFQTWPERKPVTSRYLMIKMLNSNRNEATGDMSIAEIIPRLTD